MTQESNPQLSRLLRDAMSRRQFLRVTGGLSSVAILAACAPAAPAPTGDSGDAPAADGEAAAGEPRPGGTLGLMGHQEVAGLSPEQWGPSVQTTAIRAIHDSLVLRDEMLVTQPLLAESYEVAEDGLTYTFNLRQGVLLSVGVSFDGQDCEHISCVARVPDPGVVGFNSGG